MIYNKVIFHNRHWITFGVIYKLKIENVDRSDGEICYGRKATTETEHGMKHLLWNLAVESYEPVHSPRRVDEPNCVYSDCKGQSFCQLRCVR